MRKIVLIIFFLCTPIKAFCNEPIVIVDIDFLLKNSKKGISIQKEINLESEKNLKFFEKEEKSLKEKENNISTKKNILSQNDFVKEVENFRKEVAAYNSEKSKKVQELNSIKTKKIGDLLKEINSILIDYSKKNNISTTLDKKYVIMTKKDDDITEKILKILDN